MVVLIGILAFAMGAGAVSWAVGRRARTADSGETSVSVLLVAWLALVFGMYLMRIV